MAVCLFREIVAGRSPVSVIDEDDHMLGLPTIGPGTAGHVMVISATQSLSDADDAER